MSLLNDGIEGGSVEKVEFHKESYIASGENVVTEIGGNGKGCIFRRHEARGGPPRGELGTNHGDDCWVKGLVFEVVHGIRARDTDLCFAEFVAEFETGSQVGFGNGVDGGVGFGIGGNGDLCVDGGIAGEFATADVGTNNKLCIG